MPRKVQAALIAGLMYEPLYRALEEFSATRDVSVEIRYLGNHPALNAHLASTTDPPYDLVSTHTKYAPSQAHFLAPLGSYIAEEELTDFYPKVLQLATVGGKLLGISRNIDVRLLHYRTDLLEEPPQTWNALFDVAQKLSKGESFHGFAFPGQESGLFGTFFELAETAGAHLFPDNGVPDIVNEGGRWVLGLLRRMYANGVVPRQIVDWQFDEVHRYFREGHAAMIGDWPAYYRMHLDAAQSRVHDRFSVAPYPVGPSGVSKTYGGSHTFALTHRGAANPDAVDLLRFLTSPDRQFEEASRGSVPVRRSLMQRILEQASKDDLNRWRTLESVIDDSVLIPPKMKCYPEIEDVIWRTLQSVIVEAISEESALISMRDKIAEIVRASAECSANSTQRLREHLAHVD